MFTNIEAIMNILYQHTPPRSRIDFLIFIFLPGPLYANSSPSIASLSPHHLARLHPSMQHSTPPTLPGVYSLCPGNLTEHPATPSALGSAWQKEALSKHQQDG